MSQVYNDEIDLTEEQLEIFKRYYNKGARMSDRRTKFLATEGVRFAKLLVDRFMEMRKGEVEDEIREKLFKKHFTDEEITDWFRYKDYFIGERKKDPDFIFDSKYLKIANAYNGIIRMINEARKNHKRE
jgi:hypothetical protein